MLRAPIGATYGGELIGAHADLVAFSFHPRKVLTTGEGGMLCTRGPEWGVRLRQLREHGMNVSAADRHTAKTAKTAIIEQYLETGFNYRMTDVQAAVGLVQLGRLDAIIDRRRQLGQRYRQQLGDIPGLVMAGDQPFGTTNYQSFWILLPDDCRIERDQLLAGLLERGISARRGIMASHLEPAYADHPHSDLRVTERLNARSLILPLFHGMTDEEQTKVVTSMRVLCGAPGA